MPIDVRSDVKRRDLMKNAYISLKADWVGAVDCAALEVYLAWGVLAGQPITITPFVKMDQTTRNGP
jgi:hypothetical protein